MRITATQLPGPADGLEAAWTDLVAHCRDNGPDLVVLPELIFAPWLFADRPEQMAWERAVAAHGRWLSQLDQLHAPVVVGSRPVVEDGSNYNEAFLWTAGHGARRLHRKRYLPDEDGFHEARWYARGPATLDVTRTDVGALGVLLCTELWFAEHARSYARQGVDVLAAPRATERSSLEQWIVAGRAAALLSGGFCVSSNRAGTSSSIDWAGGGYVVGTDGEMLATTTERDPAVICEVDLAAARSAKSTYPRTVAE